MAVGPWQILLLVLVILLVFGAGRLSEIGKGLGEGIKNFKKGISGDEEDESEPEPEQLATKKKKKKKKDRVPKQLPAKGESSADDTEDDEEYEPAPKKRERS